MRVQPSFAVSGLLVATTTLVQAIELDVNSTQSIVSASKIIAGNIVSYFNQSNIPGLVPAPYYFWESGLALDSLINYYSASAQDESVVKTIQDGLLFQVGQANSFEPANQTKSLGNDDQSTWALAAMTAAEKNFPQREDQTVSWLQLAINVFNDQVARWDTQTCGGGLRWQIFSFNAGYNYKNMESAGALMQLSARLARYTGNSTYTDWAMKVAQWSMDVGFVDPKSYAIYDGASTTTNCSTINHIQWTINTGHFIAGSAYAYSATNASYWSLMMNPLVDEIITVFTNNNDKVLYESACAPNNNCNVDQLAFKAVLARGLANAKNLLGTSNASMALYENIIPLLHASAQGAAAQCSGNGNNTCGSDWTATKWDGTSGLGQEVSALEIILANLPSGLMDSTNGSTTVNGTSTAAENGTNSTSGAVTGYTGAAASLSTHSTHGFLAIAVMMGGLLML